MPRHGMSCLASTFVFGALQSAVCHRGENDALFLLQTHAEGKFREPQNHDRGFVFDHEFEDWLAARGWTDCDVDKIAADASFDWSGRPQLRQRKPVASAATFDQIFETAGERVVTRGSNNNQGLIIARLDRKKMHDYLKNASAQSGAGHGGMIRQRHAPLGIVGLTGSKTFRYPAVAPEYNRMLAETPEEGMQHESDIYAPSRNGFNFHTHQGFRFRPIRGKKLFVLAASSRAAVNDEVPEELRDDAPDSELLFDMTVLPSIVVLQKHEAWFRKTKGLKFCMVREGDELMVPHFWWHLTVSVGDSLSFTAFYAKDFPSGPQTSCPAKAQSPPATWRWTRQTGGECVSLKDVNSFDDMCGRLPPPPAPSSLTNPHVCDISYKFVSAWCATKNTDKPQVTPANVLHSHLERFVQAADDGGEENVHVLLLLVRFWTQLAGALGQTSLQAELRSMDQNYSRIESPVLHMLNFDAREAAYKLMSNGCPALQKLVYPHIEVRPEMLLAVGAHP